MSGRDWTPLKEIMLVDTAVELKRVVRLYQDADFEDNHRLARRYKGQAEHLQALVDAGVEFTVNF
jgi:hypothetical protein|tara:strand:- start:8 stop:202 length:195 start_codon:yes stop_codon:yes gene_type:complete